jgi:hypothetical protein
MDQISAPTPPSYDSRRQASRQTQTYPHERPRPPHQPLQYRLYPGLLFLVYVTLLVIPWIFTCIADSRTKLTPNVVNPGAVERYKSWLAAVPLIQVVAAVAAIPFTSAIVAHTAVGHAQRWRNNEGKMGGQRLSVSQVFALADRRWETLFPLHQVYYQSRFLIVATMLFILGMSSFQIV